MTNRAYRLSTRGCWILFLLWSTWVAGVATYDYASDLEGVPSLYTERLKSVATHPLIWSVTPLLPGEGPVEMRCYSTPKRDYYIGVGQQMWIDASRSRVEEVMNDFESYPSFFPGYEEVKILERDDNRFLVKWEQIIPVFFIPNVFFQMSYVKDTKNEDRHIYRYQLKKPISVLSLSDGVIVLEEIGGRTLFTEYDFFEVGTSIIAASRIWRHSVKDIFLADVGIKLKSENPELAGKQIKKLAEAAHERFPTEACLDNKLLFPF